MEIKIGGGSVVILISAFLMMFAYFINDTNYILVTGFALVAVVLLVIAAGISKMMDKLIDVAKEN